MEKDDVLYVYERYHTYDYKEFLYWERTGFSKRTCESFKEAYNKKIGESMFESKTPGGAVKTRDLKEGGL